MKQNTFENTLKQFEYHYDLRTVFDDFLTMTCCSFGRNPQTGESYDEALYMETISKYKTSSLRLEFPKLLAHLVNEMTDRLQSETGFDVLGEYYEAHIARKGAQQFFTPWPICKFMAEVSCAEAKERTQEAPLRILDPACGSGRMLMASSRILGPYQEYYGIDIDLTCVKMTIVNLFLSGLFRSEAMCANALIPEDFKVSYHISYLPFGLFRIQEAERSRLWRILKNINAQPQKQPAEPPEFTNRKDDQGSQLSIF